MPESRAAPLTDRIPAQPTDEALLDAFLDWLAELGIDLYPAQEQAILEVLAGNNVVLATPTGSGKSLVALAAHFAALAKGDRSFYTAPIKALVSEKFFALCRDLGTDNVGMMTGDAAVNADAPVVCCTTEVLADLALREGAGARVDHVCMDEFHFYADPQRGTAWQIPLLELPRAAFLLMSATLGDTGALRDDLSGRTGRPTVLVDSDERPVPLEFEYRESPIHETIQELIDTDRAPVYVVHFTQNAATDRAQALTSSSVLDKEQRKRLAAEIGGFRFDSPFGKDLRRFVKQGIGVHHAGLLPKYRLLVERLAQAGHLKIICGTDTLGVGVNIPIRTVLFTQLCKYDGKQTRLLSVREFNQIAGRAGRKGFDDLGFVWAQAPEHVVENKRMDEKAGTDAKKRRKLVKRKPPERGYRHWNTETFTKLQTGRPEQMTSSFDVNHAMVMQLLDRPGDGCAALRALLVDNHEPRVRQRNHIRRAIQIYRSLLGAGVLEVLDEPDEFERRVRVDAELQSDFRLDQPLSPFVIQLTDELDAEDPDYALNLLSVVESVLENPRIVLLRQLDRAKDELMAHMKSEGVEYEERMEKLSEVEYPKPLSDFIYPRFNAFADTHPWVGTDNIRPKSVARDMFERAMTFREYVNEYGLKRSEGVLLRYLSDAYKAMVRTVPADVTTDETDDLTEWLGESVRQVDSSLLEEWERLRAGALAPPDAETSVGEAAQPERPDVTANRRAFRVMVRNEVFRWVRYLARREESRLADALAEVAPSGSTPWTADTLREAMAPYWDDHDTIDTGPDARGPDHFAAVENDLTWDATQVLFDPRGWGEWRIEATVDLDASRDAGQPAVSFDRISRPGDP